MSSELLDVYLRGMCRPLRVRETFSGQYGRAVRMPLELDLPNIHPNR